MSNVKVISTVAKITRKTRQLTKKVPGRYYIVTFLMFLLAFLTYKLFSLSLEDKVLPFLSSNPYVAISIAIGITMGLLLVFGIGPKRVGKTLFGWVK